MTLVNFHQNGDTVKKKPLKKPLLKAKVKYIMTTVRAEKMRKNELNQQEAENITVEQLARTA